MLFATGASRLLAVAILATGLTAQIHVSTTGNNTTGNGTVGNPYLTISKAVSVAVAGDTIKIGPGNFGDAEQIVLGSKDLTLIGSGIGQTFVRPHATTDSVLPAGFTGSPVPQDHRVAITVNAGARIDIRELTIDCDHRMPATGRLHGLYFYNGADGRVEHVQIINARSNPLVGSDQRSAGVYVRGDSFADPCDVTLRNCRIEEFGKAGVVGFFNANLRVERCEILGAGPMGAGFPAQNGIQLAYDAMGSLRFNRISDLEYSDSSYSATGILLYEGGVGTSIEGNQIARCEVGASVFRAVPGFRTLDIRANRISGSREIALSIQGHQGVTVINNVLHTNTLGPASAYDDTPAGNVWGGNNYSDFIAPGFYAIPGGSYNDFSARNQCDEFDGSNAVALGETPVEVLALDLDGAGELDFVTINESLTVQSMTVGLESSGGYVLTNIPFAGPGARPVSVTSGEFDGLPGADIAVLTTNFVPATGENKVYFFGNTGGSFALLHTEVLTGQVLVPSNIASGSLDGANQDDLVISDRGSLGVPGKGVVLLNGLNIASWTYSTLPGVFTALCRSVAVGTLDAGASMDIALTEGNGAFGQVHVYANNGSGVFTAMPASPVSSPNNPIDVTLGDMDADGTMDLVLACDDGGLLSTGTVALLLNKVAGFELHTTAADLGPASVAIGDVGDNGVPGTVARDVAVINFLGGNMTLCSDFDPSNGFAGNGNCAAGMTPRAAVFADMNSDGFSDLVVADGVGQQVVILEGAATAIVAEWGKGCAGYKDRIPQIEAVGVPAMPFQGNLSFGVELSNAKPNAVAVLDVSAFPNGLFGPCQFLLNSIDISFSVLTTPTGVATIAVPIPASPPSLNGATIYMQWIVIDPAGEFLNIVSMSSGLRVRVGN